MASNNPQTPNPSTPQSIPLQDLSRPPDSENITDGSHRRGRSSSGGERTPGIRGSLIGRGFGRAYERIAESSPSPSDRNRLNPPRPASISTQHGPSPYMEDDRSASPLDDLGGFHAAMSSVGLSFGPPMPATPHAASVPIDEDRGQPRIVIEDEDLPDSRRQVTSSDSDYFLPTETDTTPLTDNRHVQPISGASASTPRGQRHDRTSVHFVDGPSPGSHLGDDLPNLESGLHPKRSRSILGRGRSSSDRSRSRSISPSASTSPLSRAGSMMRMMSQRVVNLSNDPETVDQTIRRKSSLKQARLDTPPSFPAMNEYAHDEPHDFDGQNGYGFKPPEKDEPVMLSVRQKKLQAKLNPLRGDSLMIFSPENKLRKRLLEFLVHPAMEPVILILILIQTVLLAVDSAPSVYTDPRSKRWGSSKIDYAMFGLYVIYTVEVFVRIIVSGFLFNPSEYSTLDRAHGLRKAILGKSQTLFAPVRQPSKKRPNAMEAEPQLSVLRSFTGFQEPVEQTGHGRQQQRIRLARRAFLRHSYNRIDFVAVVSFWVSFALAIEGVESKKHIYVFKMLSCLRLIRLLGLTSGTSVILRSLKKAAPSLVHVAFLICFFWLLFAIIGVQSFKSSLRRTCVWVDPTGQQSNYTLNTAPGNTQFCGGYVNATTHEPWPWRYADGRNGTDGHKGYLCPENSICVEGENPYNGTVGFDNVGQSLEMVFVIMSSNTFTDIMYYLSDSDYLAAALFFASGIVIMSLWLVNLLIAVITSSFQVIREESKRSAFTAEGIEEPPADDIEPPRVSPLKEIYDKTYWVWILVILFDLVVQCLRSAQMGEDRRHFIDNTETVVTLILVFEIILRFTSDWRGFHRSKRNWVDLGLAIITAVIQIPAISKTGQPYAWLSIFQILRIYRGVLGFSLTRELIMVFFGNIYGLLNLIVFVFLVTFLAAIFASQLFRGDFPEQNNGNNVRVTFFDIYNSFIGMYQILSSENWTIIMYNGTLFDTEWHTSWIASTFFIIWFIFANLIVVNMFIAVIQESLDISEDDKRMQQVKAFLQQKEISGSGQSTLSLSTIFRLGRDSSRRKDPLEYGQASLEMLLKETVVKEFLDEDQPAERSTPLTAQTEPLVSEVEPGGLSSLWGRITGLNPRHEPNPFYSRIKFSRAYEDLDPRTMAKEVVSATEQRKRAQRQYLARHPGYNVSLFIFKPNNPIRKFCQKIVGPGRGSQRIEGVDPVKAVWFTFSAFIYAAIVAMVLLACVTTPLYQKEYFQTHEFSVRNWFVWADMGFAVLFTIEAIIKVIADGFFFTPNAYFRGSWGFIDGLVLITLYINVITSLYKDGGVSRAVGAFKALRALRLLNVSDSARDTFHSVMILNGWKVLSAAFVSISLLVPFAIYGVNLFNGQMLSCNDSNFPMADLSNCVGEWSSTPFNWNVLAPRSVANPYYSFDNFGSSLFILFQIVSQEGWIDVMWSGMSITGRTTQPEPYASQGNALFFIAFNLLGAVFVLTLFVSVFMRNYTEQTGVAFLTAEQRSWLELRKLLRQINPSKRSTKKSNFKWLSWCYRMAVTKHGKWQRFITTVLMCHLLVLVLEWYPESDWWDETRDYLFLGFTIVFVLNILIRIIGLGWKRFRRSSWDVYSIFAVAGTAGTTVMSLAGYQDRIFTIIHKLFLVTIALLIIPRNNQLDQLFKTAAASLTAIGNLMATWFVLFLVYAIAFTQTFSLTRFGTNEFDNLNFRNVPKALILLFRMSCGEGWNAIMEDYATIEPPYCTASDNFFESDCGSGAWARVLFVSWNIISMYIFVSLFVSLIFESFSYVYQRSNGLSVVTREEIRRFKQAWATFDPDGSGYISKEHFPRLLGELSGVFEMRIYDSENSVGSILEDVKVNPRLSETNSKVIHGVDIDKLNRRLERIPVEKIRQRRQRMNIFYEEVLVSADADRGISFTSCLMILAHYNVISDSKSLRLEEFLRRRARLQRVEEAVRRNVVIGFFDTLYWARAFRRQMQGIRAARMAQIPHFTVPEIFVDDQDDETSSKRRTGIHDPHDPPTLSPHSIDQRVAAISSPRTSGSSSGFNPRGVSPIDTNVRNRRDSRTTSPTHPDFQTVSMSPQLSPHRLSNVSNLSYMDTAYHGARQRPATPTSPGAGGARAGSVSPTAGIGLGVEARRGSQQESGTSGVSSSHAQGMLESLDSSAWGESIRRSFTMRRSRYGRS